MAGWLRPQPVVGVVEQRLVCLPHAGGSWFAFADWPALLPPGVELIAVQYPGRQDRLSEPCVEDMDQMADLLAEELLAYCDLPMSLFGHSMGSAVAYEIARRLERDAGVVMRHIFMSGRRAPHRRYGEPHHRLPDSELVAHIRALGGADLEVYGFAKLWPVILPPLRADLRLLDRHRPAELVRLNAPITALGGDSDHTCPVTELAEWADATDGPFEIEVFDGGHHYLAANQAAVVSAVVRRIGLS
jgi:pyochelin biosynthetic protein PchC